MFDIHTHLNSRYMNTSNHIVWINTEEKMAVFPLWNLSGQMVGYQNYRPLNPKEPNNDPKSGRYYTHRNKDMVSVWGLESWNFSRTLFVCEGIFDACRLTNHGVSAIALLSNNPTDATKRWLWTIRQFRPVFSICDSGPSGRKLASLSHKSHTMTVSDLGDSSESFVSELIEKFADGIF